MGAAEFFADSPMVVRSPAARGRVRVNRQFAERLGLSASDLKERALLEWIHPDDREGIEQALRSGEGRASARHRTRTDEWLHFDWQVKTHSGELAVLGLHQSAAEASDERGAREVPPGRSSMSDLLDAMARIVESNNPGMRCSILLLDEKREHIAVGAGPSLPSEYNAAVEGLAIGPTVGSCGTAAFWQTRVIVENIAEDSLWADLRRAAALAGVSACWSHPFTGADGKSLGAIALYYHEPRAPTRAQIHGLAIAARMVGLAVERHRLEAQLHDAAKMEALGVLAGGIAHDFNNLLTVVLGNAELAANSVPAGSEARERLREIVNASVSATELCEQMLAYAGRGARTAEPLDCNELVAAHAALLRVALSKKAQLIFDLHPAPLGVLADGSQLRQVIMNLITNASDAIGNSEGRIVVSTRSRNYGRDELERDYRSSKLEPGEYVVLSVNDSGRGMSPATKARIFDPFFTTKGTGRGLGLAAVQGIVRGHRGAIAVETRLGAGTTFHVLLPRVSLPDRVLTPPAARKPSVSRARILVADDEPAVRKLFQGVLESAGYEVIVACDGQEAVDVFRREFDSIHCVLLDLSMPKLDGEEAFRELRKLRSDVPVILSSGFAEQHVVDRFRDTGLAGVIQKPVRVDVLLAKIADTLACAAH
jgi:signal transduction histidine kinase/ActR/RegA family two-component response regulator